MSKICNSSREILAQGLEDSGVSVLRNEQRRHEQCKIGNVGRKLYRDSVLIDHRKIVIRKFDKTEKKSFNARDLRFSPEQRL